ncbi:MAG TPA: type II toxin-antitoxin system HicB family antitoxin [Ktedonobacterales bacterium]
MNMPPYSMEIVWSDEDHCFVVSLPEWGDLAKTFGDTYEEAVRNGQEALQGLIESYQIEGRPLPEPRKSVA